MTIAVIILAILLSLAILYIIGLRRAVKSLTEGMKIVADDRDRCADYILDHYILQSAEFREGKAGVRKINDEQRKEAERIYNAIKEKREKAKHANSPSD